MNKEQRLAVLVPSRGRPENIWRLLTTWKNTEATAQLIVCVDSDDVRLPEYVAMLTGKSGVEVCVAPRMRLGPTLNYWAAFFAQRYAYLGFMGDDHVPRTLKWDEAMIATIAGQPIGMVYGNDLFQKEFIPTAVVMTSSIVETLGYMVAPGLIHICIDSFWKILGTETRSLVYMPDVIIEHMHPCAGKVPNDEFYIESNQLTRFDSDFAIFEEYRETRFPQDVEKLLAIGDTDEQRGRTLP